MFINRLGSLRSLTNKRYFSCTNTTSSRALLFPGQGNQKAGTLKDYNDKYPKQTGLVLEEMDEALNFKLSDVLLDPNYNNVEKINIDMTSNAQPAIFATSYAIVQILNSINGGDISRHFPYIFGHSLGEYTALTVAGSTSFFDTLKLVRARGLAMEESKKHFLTSIDSPNTVTGMYAVLLRGISQKLLDDYNVKSPAELIKRLFETEISKDIHPLYKYLQLAIINSSNQVVFSGPKAALDELLSLVKSKLELSRSFKILTLNVSAPFHSPVMEFAQKELESYVESSKFAITLPSSTSVIANRNALPFDSVESVKHSVIHSCTESVFWLDSVNYAIDQGVKEFVAIGPGNVGDFTKREVEKSASTRLLEYDEFDDFIKTLE